MKKVLFIVTTLGIGGLETYLLRFLNFAGDKIDATVLCKSGKGGELEMMYKATGAIIIKQKMSYLPLFSSIKLYNLMKKEKFNCVCDFTGDFAGLPLYIARVADIEKRVSFYREAQYQFKHDAFRMFYKKIVNDLVFQNSTKILANSEAGLDFFHPKWKKNRKKFEIIRNGVPIELFKVEFDKAKLRLELGIPNDAFVIGHVGRFDNAKNHTTIIEVAEQLCSRYDKVYFLLCGLGVQEGVEEMESFDTINSKIIMPGIRDDIPNILRILNAYYFPSLTEGQPNALIEAMMVGLPFVASDIDPIKESIPMDFYDCLVPAKDTLNAIKKLSTYIEGRSSIDFTKIQHFAQHAFRADVKFNQFLKEL